MRFHGVSVFGNSPPVSVVSTGVDDGLADAVGVAEADADGVADAEAEGVAEADGVALGTTAAQASFVMVLVSRVTAPSRAKSWPLKVAPVVAVIEAIANT